MVVQIIVQGACMVFGITIGGFLLSKLFSRNHED